MADYSWNNPGVGSPLNILSGLYREILLSTDPILFFSDNKRMEYVP